MKQDIRELFRNGDLNKMKLPEFHREEFLEKLQAQENEKPKKRNLYFVIKVAASVAILISMANIFTRESKPMGEEFVNEKVDVINDKLRNEVEEKKHEEEIVFEEIESDFEIKESIELEQILVKGEIRKLQLIEFIQPKINPINITQEVSFYLEKWDGKKSTSTDLGASKTKIKVDSDALLFSVSHSPKEVLTYYKENDLLRDSVLLALEKELEKSNLKVDANELLLEIEFGLERNSFKRNLLEKIELKLKDLSKALANN